MTGQVVAGERRPGAGRRRDDSMTQQILVAVLDIIADVGYQSLRVEAVAAQAGVSLGSVYRRWPTKQELVIAALESSGTEPFTLEGTGDPESDLTTMLTVLAQGLSEPRQMRLALLAADPVDPAVARAARRRIPPIRNYLRSLFAGRIGADNPALDLLVDLGPALVWYRALVAGEHIDAPALVEDLTRYVFNNVRPTLPTTAPADFGGGFELPSEPVTTRKDATRNRRRIFDAATALFAERPYQQVQLDDIAGRAGVSRATVVRHVGTKHQLQVEIYKQRLRDIIELCANAEAEADPWQGLEFFFRTAASWVSNDAGMRDYFRDSGLAFDDPEWQLLAQQVPAALDRVLDRAQAAGVLRVGLSAVDVFPLISYAVTAARIPEADSTLYTDILLHGLRAPAQQSAD